MLVLSVKQKNVIFRYFKKIADNYINILKQFELSVNKDNIIINFIHFNVKKVYSFDVYNTYKEVKYHLYKYVKDFIKRLQNN